MDMATKTDRELMVMMYDLEQQHKNISQALHIVQAEIVRRIQETKNQDNEQRTEKQGD